MPARLRALWEQLLDSLWFVPGAIVLAAIVLAVGMVELSTRVDNGALSKFPRIFGASADSSRAMLSAIASSVITVAGVTFSITMVAVTQASSQYTPRILRNFMRDRSNQVVLGVFVGIFAYCLVVLRTIRSSEEVRFVPALAVIGGIVLALVGMGVLIFFVHHIASTLQASTIVERVMRDTVEAVDRLFPERVGEEASGAEPARTVSALDEAGWRAVPAPATGYVQSVDGEGLLRLAAEHDRVVRMAVGVGEFVVEGTPLAWVAPRDAAVPAARDLPDDGVGDLYVVRAYRTVRQDAGFGVRQLVDVALKALSPGVNDTTTAVLCVDYLGAILVRLAGRRVESPFRAIDGVTRVIARGPTFESLLRASFDEIRQNAAGNVSVLARLLATIERAAPCTRSMARRALLGEQVELVMEVAERSVPSPYDASRLCALAAQARAAVVSRG